MQNFFQEISFAGNYLRVKLWKQQRRSSRDVILWGSCATLSWIWVDNGCVTSLMPWWTMRVVRLVVDDLYSPPGGALMFDDGNHGRGGKTPPRSHQLWIARTWRTPDELRQIGATHRRYIVTRRPIWRIWTWRARRLPGRWPDGGLSEGDGHDGPGVCLGDGQKQAYLKDRAWRAWRLSGRWPDGGTS